MNFLDSTWSIVTCIGVVETLLCGLVISITGWSVLAAIPLVISICVGFTGGVAFLEWNPAVPSSQRIAAIVFTDIGWLVSGYKSSLSSVLTCQATEAGVTFYSYCILVRLLKGTPRRVFMLGFWLLMLTIVGVRFTLTFYRVELSRGRYVFDDLPFWHPLHVTYFAIVTAIETWSAFFLLRTFFAARRLSAHTSVRNKLLFAELIRSTEFRLALLAIIGLLRLIQWARPNNIAAYFDRLSYITCAMFPIVML